MIFREAKVEDIPALSRIRLSVKENALSDPRKVTPEVYADYLGDSGKGWVCEVDGEPVGFSVASLKEASIWALFVAPGYEGKGIGTRLLNLAVGWLFERGAPGVRLSTEAGTRADTVYEKQGWKRGKIRPDGEVEYRLDRTGRT